MEKQLYRNPRDGALAGVCSGLGEYVGIDKIWVRLFFITSIFFGISGMGMAGPLVYIVLWVALPEKPIQFLSSPFSVDYRPSSDENPSLTNRGGSRKSVDRQVAGMVLLVIGIVFLLHQFEFIWWNQLVRLWPVIIIALGVFTILCAFKNKLGMSGNKERDKTCTK